jgi:3-oxoadipate enol-lactonase
MKTTERAVTVQDGVNLHVAVYEADELPSENIQRDVVLLHGWPNSGRVWQGFAESMLLADTSFRLIAPTFRGYGDSDGPDTGYTCEQFADDIAYVILALSLSSFALIGHSMGGKIAQMVAARQPDGLNALALIAPVPLIATPVHEERKAAQRANYGDDIKTRGLITGMAARPLSEEVTAMLVEDGLRCAEAAFVGWIDPMREEDFSALLPQIAVPTLVIHGQKDPLRTEDVLRTEVADPITNSKYAALPGVGHLPHIEDPSALALMVVNFLDNIA